MQFTSEQITWASSIQSNTLVSNLGIEFNLGPEGVLQATMPVDQRTKQPMGLLHGGATAALAESLGSMGSAMLIDLNKFGTVGLEITANHLRGVTGGNVTATGELVHKGRTTHVWDIRVHNEKGELCAICRLTNMIIERR